MTRKPKNAYIDMVGDLFHYGHIRLLKKIKEQGYTVIVGVHSDEVVESYKRTPILKLSERIEIISACKYVDAIIPNVPLIVTKEFMDQHNIDMCFHSHSEKEHEAFKQKEYRVPILLKKFTRMDYCTSISTTEIINRILTR